MTFVIYALGALRGLVGLGALTFPRPTTTLFGLGAIKTENADTAVITRLFGCRDFILGGALLWFEPTSAQAQTVLQLGVAIDSIDFLSYLIGYFQKDGISPYAWVAGGWGAGLFALMGYMSRP